MLFRSEAKMVAEFHHRNQDYDIYPYMKHIQDVVDIGELYRFDDELIAACYLHDIVEDCNMSVSKIRKHFGEYVAYMVACVTDPIDLLNRKAKKEQVYIKLAGAASEDDFGPLCVKLADRIANVEHSKRTSSPQWKMYLEEYPKFRERLWDKEQALSDSILFSLWKHLDMLFDL